MTENGPIDYYAVLGVDREATIEQIEEAYFALARKLHPDIAGGGHEASERFMIINEAFQTLSDPELRQRYDSGDSGGEASAGVKSGEAVEAERAQRGMQDMDRQLKRLTRNARRLIREGDYWRATELLEKMLVKYPRQPDLRRILAESAAARHKYREAAEHLKVACEVEYFNADNQTMLGDMYAAGKQWSRALEAYHDALSWNEEHEGARKGIEKVEKLLEKEKPFLQRLPGLIRSRLGGGK
jgi:curved DNA-binding protein CbpA